MNLKFRFMLIGICIGILLKLFVFDILKVEGLSMEPAVRSGSYLIVNKLAFGLAKPFSSTFFIQWATPQKGDIVIYFYNNCTDSYRHLLSPNNHNRQIFFKDY